MTHQINYSAESDSVDDQTAIDIIGTVATWASNGADRHFDGLAYDRVNDSLRITVRLTGVDAIDTKLSDLDDGLSSINTSEGTSFPMASDVANVRPER